MDKMRTIMALARGTEDPGEESLTRKQKRKMERKKKVDDAYANGYDHNNHEEGGGGGKKKRKKKKKKKDKSGASSPNKPPTSRLALFQSKKKKKLRRQQQQQERGGGENGDYYEEDDRRNQSRSHDDEDDPYGYNNGNAGNHGNQHSSLVEQDEYDNGFQLDNVQQAHHQQAHHHQQQQRNDGAIRVQQHYNDVDSKKKFRVKPFHAFSQPTYLNEAELYQHMMAPTEELEHLTSYLNPSTKNTRRIHVSDQVRRMFGSPKEDGRIGSLRVEVLGCVGLDRASKPEIATYLVVGDCAFCTDTIPGVRSPMWPYSAKRAAVFPLHHAFAKLFVGVFDVKQRKNNEADAFCGRVAIDIPALRPNTEYDVTFPLRCSSFIYDRRPRGVVRLRFSMHWFSERSALLSYLKRPRNPLAFSKQAKKQPTIPCGDPKTFRNVAVTVHGQDFPGKYTRGAFRATMREFNLYQQNLRFLVKVTILDCILWENPLLSFYLLSSSTYSLWYETVRYVPPFFVGFVLFLLLENYINHNATVRGHLGYQPLTILEVFKGLVRDGRDHQNSDTSTKKGKGPVNFQSILVKKRPRRQVVTEDGKTADIELANHREFPFSERFEYLKFSASEAIAPSPASKNKKSGSSKGATDAATARRLSIYMSPVEEQAPESESESDSEEGSDGGDRDDEGMMEQADDGFENMDDSDDERDPDEDEDGGGGKTKGRLFDAGKASTTRRIRVGPAQNSDKSGKKVPPQVHLSRVEHMLHRATKNISVEHVHFPAPHLTMDKNYNAKGPASDVITAKEKQNFDDFDKLLGFRTKNPNPIVRITSSFLGPLMRIIRIVIYATRIGFNVTTWTDPFLTFWFFAFLVVLEIILLIFPWRSFFAVTTLLLLGPQNIAVRKYLERRAKEKEIEEQERKEFEEQNQLTQGGATPGTDQNLKLKQKQAAEELANKNKKNKRSVWGRTRKNDDDDMEENELNEQELWQSPRPAFCAHSRPTRKTQARDVAVPYFRFRKDRFYDWPPDPTVSRATPILQPEEEEDYDDYDGGGGGRRGGGRRDDYDDYDYDEEYEEEQPRGVRQRKKRGKSYDDYEGGHPAY